MAAETQTNTIGAEGFPDPYEFLDPYQDREAAYEGLYTFLADELSGDGEATVRDFVDTVSLDIRDQSAYSGLLRSMIQQRHGQYPAATHPDFYPQLDASINYLKFRLVLGIMAPAIDTALKRTKLEHTRVRVMRTLVASGMVRTFINDQFDGNPDFEMAAPTSLLEQELSGYLNQFFNAKYKRGADDSIVDEYSGSSAPMLPISRGSDEYRFFDIKDYSTRLRYSSNGKAGTLPILPSADELSVILEQQRTQPVQVTTNGNNTNGKKPADSPRVRGADVEVVRRQVLVKAFEGLGIISNATLVKTLGELDAILPGNSFRGRETAYAAAVSLLQCLSEGAKVSRVRANRGGARADISPGNRELVISRLQVMVERFGTPWLPVDATFRVSEAAYIDRYGEPPTTRDYWDYWVDHG